MAWAWPRGTRLESRDVEQMVPRTGRDKSRRPGRTRIRSTGALTLKQKAVACVLLESRDQNSGSNCLNASTIAQSPAPDILAPHVAGVKAAGDRRIGRTLDDGSTIGEQGQLVRFGPKLQYEIVVANGPVRLEASAHLHKVDRSMALV